MFTDLHKVLQESNETAVAQKGEKEKKDSIMNEQINKYLDRHGLRVKMNTN